MLADRAAKWLTVGIPGVRIHMRRGSAAEADTSRIKEAVSTMRSELLALLGAVPSDVTVPAADLFFVGSREDTQRLAGRPIIGFAQQDEPTVVFVYATGYGYATLLRHELTHLYTFQLWGSPRASQWLVEGVAVWAAGRCQGHSPDELAAGARARGALVPIERLATAFREIGEEVAMPQAGSIVGFLVRQGGLAALRDLWSREPPAEHPLGPDGVRLEKVWLDELAGVRPATLDVPRLTSEGC
jgi:hypothetical protein